MAVLGVGGSNVSPDEEREDVSRKVQAEGATGHYTEWERDLIDSFDLPARREHREPERPAEDLTE